MLFSEMSGGPRRRPLGCWRAPYRAGGQPGEAGAEGDERSRSGACVLPGGTDWRWTDRGQTTRLGDNIRRIGGPVATLGGGDDPPANKCMFWVA